ncbi:MAG: transketolase, partial [Planctomycetes bacterium]|nr:transketolase [Planctomycetota bacterium]
WHAQVINGNDIEQVIGALETASDVTDQPTAIISQTQKGFGILPIMEEEGDLNYHGKPLSPDLAKKALALIK